MKNVFLINLFLISIGYEVHAQLGSSCSNPKILFVADSACNFVSTSASEKSNNFDSIPVAFFNNVKVKPREIDWYKFTATSKNLTFKIDDNSRNFTVVFLKGTCNSLVSIGSFSSYNPSNAYLGSTNSAENLKGAVENLIIGQEYFVQICFPVIPVLYSIEICLVKAPDIGMKIVSTTQGGDWTNKTSWVQNKVPGPLDTAVIADGSTISINTRQSIVLKRLEIGQNGPAIAKLSMNIDKNTFYIYGDLVIHQGDSLKGKSALVFGDEYFLYGNVINDGVISYMNKKQRIPFTFNAQFYFRSRFPQSVTGVGKFVSIGIPCLIVDNPAGVKWDIDGYIRTQIYLKRGLFDNSNADLRFDFDSLNQADGSVPSISIENGRLAKKINNVNLAIAGLNSNSLVYAQIKDDSLNLNRDIEMDQYYPFKTSIYNLELNKWAGRKLNVNRSFELRILRIENGILVGRAQDTLTYFTHSSIPQANKTKHSTFGYHRYIAKNSMVLNWGMVAWVGGKGRSLTLTGTNYLQPLGTTIVTNVLNQPPTGTIQSPGTTFLGPHVVEIKSSNGSLGTDTKLKMEVYKSDNFIGLKNTWRIVQAPSPGGPWKVLDVTTFFVEPNDSILTGILGTIQPVNLSNGNYFAFASVVTTKDAVLNKVLAVPTFGFGCGNGVSTTVKMLVNNNGLTNISDVTVGCLVNGNIYSNTYISGFNGFTQLEVGKVDTFRFEIPDSNEGIFPIKYFVSSTGEGNRSNDTIRGTINTLALPIPARINFDTCKYLTNTGVGYYHFGQPIVKGWENGPKGPVSPIVPFDGSAFSAIRTEPPFTSNKVHLTSKLYLPNGFAMLRTFNFGPIGNRTWLGYKLNLVDNPNGTNEIRPGDSIAIEASDNCGESYRLLRAITRSNFITYLDPGAQLNSNPSLPPLSQWWDSLPFPPGKVVHFRIRLKTNQNAFNFGNLSFDDLQVIDTLFTNVSFLMQRENEMSVYPNPAASEIFVQGPEGEQLSEFFYTDITGRRSRLEMDSENRIGIKAIPTGVYILEAKGKRGTYKKRFVKE